MRSFLEGIRSARKIELLLAVVAIAVLMMQCADNRGLSAGTELEMRMEAILTQIEGAGNVRVMVSEDHEGMPEGALVIADGAGNISVMLRLRYSVGTILGLEPDQIEVMPGKGQK